MRHYDINLNAALIVQNLYDAHFLEQTLLLWTAMNAQHRPTLLLWTSALDSPPYPLPHQVLPMPQDLPLTLTNRRSNQ